ncbi:MAG: ROK family protein [Anaerolineaceae bacterium]|nr:ROK family protein [Anaerolineaceae bacterium]
MSEAIIAVDLGGTRIRAARLNQRLDIVTREETLTETERGLDYTLERFKAMVQAVWPTDGTTVTGIGVSSPGPLNPMTGVIVAPPNLRGWHNVPLGDILRETFGVPVYVGNDANVAALAETVMGAAQGCRHVIYITVSTGIGSGMLIDGKMLLGKNGLGAEAGHIIIQATPEQVRLELETAGPALALKAKSRIEAGEQTMMKELVNGDLSQITGATVGKAANVGDRIALEIVREAGRILGLGMVSLLHLFNPEILVFGGGVSDNLGELLFAPMRDSIQKYCIDDSYWRDLRIESAALGENVSIFGAAALVVTKGGLTDVNEAISHLKMD